MFGKKNEISIYLPADFYFCFLPLLYGVDGFKIRALFFGFCVSFFCSMRMSVVIFEILSWWLFISVSESWTG